MKAEIIEKYFPQLTPEQQQHIKEMFEEMGYTHDLVFDGFTFVYDFS